MVTADESEINWGESPAAQEWTPPWLRAARVPEVDGIKYLKVGSDPRPMLGSRSDADLIVVGRNVDRRAHTLGGTTEWLLHHPPSPLAIIRSGDVVDRVTVCVDGSVHATAALETFAALPFAAAASVTVLGVDDGRSDAGAAVAAGAGQLEGRVSAVETKVLSDIPTRAILDHLDSTGPDLVVVGTKGLTGWKRIRLGSTAGAVVRSATCNSLIGSAEL